MSVEAFGPSAQRFAAGLSGVEVLVADATQPAEALAACARRKRENVRFLSCVVLDEPRALVANEYAAPLIGMPADDDGRRRLFDGLAAQALSFDGVAQSAVQTLEPQRLSVLRDVWMMGDGALVRSYADAERLAALFGRRRELVVRWPGIDDSVPAVTPAGRGDAIVVWAANSPARHTALFAYALKDFYMPVIVACNETPQFPHGNVEYVPADGNALQRAAIVIDASIGGPATAIALAGRGIPLAVTTTSGASEFVLGAVPYEPWSWRSIHNAALRALGAPRSSVSYDPGTSDIVRGLEVADASIARNGELVSILLPTYNRRHLLPRALDALDRQVYRDVEIVVVNDGGEAVDDIVAQHPKARLIVNETNLGITQSTSIAMKAARGTYVAFCSDDDMLYPDSIGRWVAALSRSNAKVAHGNTVMRFERGGAAAKEVSGYRLIWKETVDHRDSLYTPHTSLAVCLLHRSVIEDVGYFEDSPVCDIEYLLRISRRYDFVHVDQPGMELEYDSGKGQGSVRKFSEMAKALERAYARFPTQSAEVLAGRQNTLNWYAQRDGVGHFFDPEMTLAAPERSS